MQETRTEFKPKTCPKCKRIHQEETGVLCAFCKADNVNALNKQRTAPANYFVKCLVEREGDSVTNVGNVRYIFKKNEAGDSVCEIINPGHYNHLIKTPQFEAYTPGEIEEETEEPRENYPALTGTIADHELVGKSTAEIISILSSEGKTDTEIAEYLGDGFTRQRVTKIRTGA